MGKPKYSAKKRASNARWDGANLDRIGVAMPKGSKDKIKARAEKLGLSVNKYLSQLIGGDI